MSTIIAYWLLSAKISMPPLFYHPPSKDQTLLVRVDAFLILYLGLDIVNGVRALSPPYINLF